MSFRNLLSRSVSRAAAAFGAAADGRAVHAWFPEGAGEAGFTLDAGPVHVGPLSVKSAALLGLANDPDRSASVALSASALPYTPRRGLAFITAPADGSVYDPSAAEYWSVVEVRSASGVLELDCQRETAATVGAGAVTIDGEAPDSPGISDIDGGAP